MSKYRRYFDNLNKPVFITIVTYNRKNILIENINILKNSIKYVKSKYNFEIVAISILKNHFHMILLPEISNEIPQIIRTIKYNFSINIPSVYITKDLSNSAIKRGEKGVWQRRYYDHIIRSEEDLKNHIDYIHYNSWKNHKISPKDWKYSSFIKFVKNNYYDENWCDFDEKVNINQSNWD